MTYQIDVQIDPAVLPDLPSDLSLEWFERFIGRVLERLNQPAGIETGVLVTSDAQIRELNNRFRGVDAATDVLAFSQRGEEGFVTPPDAASHLGDVVISLPTAKRQAADSGHPLHAEIALLIVHGLLHLVGYDHATADEEAVMWWLQDDILRDLGIEPPELGGRISEQPS